MNNVSVIVNSCDAYRDLWDPFFCLYKRYWNPGYSIVLNTESLDYTYDDLNVRTFRIYQPGEIVPWGERLLATLQKIDSEYIIFLLDDFFFNKTVDQPEIERCIHYMDSNPEIASFNFLPIGAGRNIDDNRYEGFERRPQKCEYKLNCQAALWRRTDLIKYIRPHESAWYFETLGSKRASRYHELFYSRKADSTDIMSYFYEMGGAVHRGKWNKEVYQFCENNGIDLSGSTREIGIYIPGDKYTRRQYYISRLNPKTIGRALIARWKSLKW